MSHTQSHTHLPTQNPCRLHIQASGEVGPEQMNKLDITRQIEFQKHRSNFIGEGRHSQVYRGWYTQSSGEKISVAVKVPMCTPQSRRDVEERLMREIITWKRVSREEDVADFMGIYRAPNEPPYLVLPYYKNNNLLQYMATRSPDERLARAKEIARGLDRLHSIHVIHGDLKLENIFVSDAGRAQIADFSESVIPELEGFTTAADRDVRHFAPELMPITESNPPNPTREGDIFSLGILFLQIFDGRIDCLPYSHVPVSHRDPMDTELLKRIHGGDRPRQGSYPNISDNRWNIIAACWVADPSTRPNIRQVRSWLAQL